MVENNLIRKMERVVQSSHCSEEMGNISFIGSLKRILQLAIDSLHTMQDLSKQAIQSMFELIIGKAIIYFSLKRDPQVLTEV